MKSILVLCGMMMLGTIATPNNFKNAIEKQDRLLQSLEITAPMAHETCVTCRDIKTLNLADIPFIEQEDSVDLGFDTADYLPEGFDPYKVYVDLDAINYIEENEEEELGSELAAWLPEGFDPYSAPADFASISYIETESDLYPAIETKNWLPEGFDPYAAYPANAVICKEWLNVSSR